MKKLLLACVLLANMSSSFAGLSAGQPIAERANRMDRAWRCSKGLIKVAAGLLTLVGAGFSTKDTKETFEEYGFNSDTKFGLGLSAGLYVASLTTLKSGLKDLGIIQSKPVQLDQVVEQ